MSQVNSDNFSEDASFRETEGKKYALVVGINKPDKVHSLPVLRYAESDATGIGYLLSRKECNFVFPSGLLIGEAASTQNVRKAITYLIDGKSENDLLLFYFIGHGYPVEIDEGKFEVYLVTADFDPREAKLNPDAYLSLSWIREMLYEHQKMASIVSVLDCNDAKYIVESLPPNKQLAPSLEAFAKNIWKAEQSSAPSHRTWAVLASTYEHIDDRAESHALMTGLTLDALSGDARDALDRNGDLTLQTLHIYLQTQMKRLGSGRQHPITQGTFHNLLILAHHPSKNPVPRSPEDYSQSSLKPPFDMDISPATFDDLDFEQVQTFLKKERVKLQRDYRADPDEQAQMQALGLLRGEYPSYGALLCFGRNPSPQIAGAYTRCIYWSDTEHLSGWEDNREYRGSLLEQFTQACNFLRNHLRFSRVIDRSGSSERPEIPFRALEEAVANALIHREYATKPDRIVRTEGVQVEIFSHRVEIKSPGGPPVPLNTELPEGHPRNPQIRRIFYLAGYAESMGTGIRRIQHLVQEAGLQPPNIRTSEQTFTIILFRPPQSTALSVLARRDAQASQRISQMRIPVTPRLPESQKVYDHDGLVYTDSQPAPHQSNPDKNNKQLVPAVPKASPRPHRPLLAELRTPLIVVVILALVVGVYFVSRQSYLPILTPHPGLPSTTIKIASDLPTSGLDTTGGLPLQNGVQLAIIEANNEHLLPGYILKLVPYDDVGTGNRHDPQVGARNLKLAIADNLVAGVIGPGTSSVGFKELPIANQAPLALLSPSATFPCLTKSAADDPNCTETNDIVTQMRPTKQLTFFRLATTDDRQGKAAADYFSQTKHYSKVLLLKDDSNPYSSGLAQAFQTKWQLRGQVNSVDLPQNTSSEQDYQNKLLVASSQQFQPDLIYFAGDDPNASYVLQALSNIATLKTVPFAGGDGIMDNSLLQTATNLRREAPIYASLPIEDSAHSGTPTGADFETNYTLNGYQYYRPYAAAAYDCTMMLIQAIKTALQKGISTPHGMQDHAGAVQFRQAVLKELRQLPPYTGATGTHSFDANGDTRHQTVSFYQADLSASPASWTWLQQVNA